MSSSNLPRHLSAREKKETWKVRVETYHTTKVVHVIISENMSYARALPVKYNELETGIEGEMNRESRARTSETYLFLARQFENLQFHAGFFKLFYLDLLLTWGNRKRENSSAGLTFCTCRALLDVHIRLLKHVPFEIFY